MFAGLAINLHQIWTLTFYVFRFLASLCRRQRRSLLTIKFIDRPARLGVLNQSRNCAVEFDLIVVLTFRENRHFVEVFGEPRVGQPCHSTSCGE